MIIMSKMGSTVGEGPNAGGSGRIHLTLQLEASMRALKTDYLDILMVHRPDPRTPIEETLRVLDDFVRQGKVRYLGTSNFAAWEMAEAAWVSKTEHLERFVCVEPEYNMLKRTVESELVPFCERYGVGMTPFYPLAGGFLTGSTSVELMRRTVPDSRLLPTRESAGSPTVTSMLSTASPRSASERAIP
jgi:aryl-alcohol dehydrogenase-like predicted oxidoreductase